MKKKLAALLALSLSFSLAVAPASAVLTVEDGRELLNEHYVEQVPSEVLRQDTLQKMLKELDDPYTVVMDRQEYRNFYDFINGPVLVGIGLIINQPTDDGAKIDTVYPGSPAAEAGIKVGDWVSVLNGVELKAGVTLNSVSSDVEEGSVVTLTVIHRANGQSEDYTLKREKLQTATVGAELLGNAGYLAIDSFGENTPEEMLEAMKRLDPHVELWVIDLTGNPGGMADSVARAIHLFTGAGPVAYLRDRSGTYNPVDSYVLPSKKAITDKPVLILQGAYSASAAEIFSAAARDFGFGLTIGQRSFGKGVAQQVFDKGVHGEDFGGDQMKITTHRVFSPKGVSNHVIGVLPAIRISNENLAAVTMLLTAGKPERAEDHLKLELAGQTFYLNTKEAQSSDYFKAFAELLAALPEQAKLYRGHGYQTWDEVTPKALADQFGLSVEFRTFSDLSGSDYGREIEKLAAYELVSGVGGGKYAPCASVTRAQFCAMLKTALNLDVPDESTEFVDVDDEAWYADAVAAVTHMGFADGVGADTFKPEAEITYEQMCVMLSAAAGWYSRGAKELSEQGLTIYEMVDYAGYDHWAQIPARNMDRLGAGLDNVQPQTTVTREMAAAMICRLMEQTGLFWTAPEQN